MPINLSNLDISLDSFNQAASGKYNIGQIKLGADGTSVVRTNSRKVLTFLNKTQIRPEESLAIKNAFCNALQREGLPDDALADIRRKLGLRDSMRETLKAGNIKPLSAAEVREIIDEYAGTINQARGSGKPHLATSDDFYRGVSQETLDSRKAVRESRNSRSESLMETTVGGTVNMMLDLLEGPSGDSPLPFASKAIAREICQVLRSPRNLSAPGSSLDLTVAHVTLKHGDSGTIVAKFSLGDGSEFSVDTNMTRAELFAQMQNVLAPKPDAAPEKAPEEPPKAPEEPQKAQSEAPKAPAEPPPPPKRKPLNPMFESVVEDLRQVFSTVKDPVVMAAKKSQVREGLRKTIKGVRLSDETLDAHASASVRQKLSDPIVDSLVVALREARGIDARNAELVHQVRNVIDGDESIDAEELVGKIIDALDTPQVDFTANLDKAVEDDFDKPLNINELLGNN